MCRPMTSARLPRDSVVVFTSTTPTFWSGLKKTWELQPPCGRRPGRCAHIRRHAVTQLVRQPDRLPLSCARPQAGSLQRGVILFPDRSAGNGTCLKASEHISSTPSERDRKCQPRHRCRRRVRFLIKPASDLLLPCGPRSQPLGAARAAVHLANCAPRWGAPHRGVGVPKGLSVSDKCRYRRPSENLS